MISVVNSVGVVYRSLHLRHHPCFSYFDPSPVPVLYKFSEHSVEAENSATNSTKESASPLCLKRPTSYRDPEPRNLQIPRKKKNEQFLPGPEPKLLKEN